MVGSRRYEQNFQAHGVPAIGHEQMTRRNRVLIGGSVAAHVADTVYELNWSAC